jgi:hypothetical protein
MFRKSLLLFRYTSPALTMSDDEANQPTCSSNRAWENEIRSYQVYLANDRKPALGCILIAVAALRFCYKVTVYKDWSLEEIIPAPKKPQKLPYPPTPEEVCCCR